MVKHFFKLILLCSLCIVFCLAFFGAKTLPTALSGLTSSGKESTGKAIAGPPYDVLKKAMALDIQSRSKEIHISWIDGLAYLAALYGDDFKQYDVKHLEDFYARLENGESMQSVASALTDFSYYQDIYGAAFQGLLGEYQIQVSPADSQRLSLQEKYGLKAFFPIPKDFDYKQASNQKGIYSKQPEQSFFIPIGTPVIAIEGGVIQFMDWDSIDGWHMGIKSFDHRRCYYYTHLRKDEPFEKKLYPGKAVNAGDIIAYSGQTGYSIKENGNNLDQPQLSIRLQIWPANGTTAFMDLQAITQLLTLQSQDVLQNQAESPAMGSEDTIPVPIIMYHGLIEEKRLQTQYFIPPGKFKEDLEYLQTNGYETIVMSDLIRYVEYGTPLPEKPIILAFDDGYYNNYLYAYPLLKEYHMKAVFSIIGRYTDEYSIERESHAAYSHLTWNQINEMMITGHVEIQNHTYDLHSNQSGRSGSKQKPGESMRQYRKALTEDLGKLQNRTHEMTGWMPNTFTYPFGYVSNNSLGILKDMGFKATLGCQEGINQISRDPQCLFLLNRCLRSPEASVEKILLKYM